MRSRLTFAIAALALSACSGSKPIAPPENSLGIEMPSDTSGRNALIAGTWLTDVASMPKSAIRLVIAPDGTYTMKLLESRDALVDVIISASAGDLVWTKSGFLQGADPHPTTEMKYLEHWTAGFDEAHTRMTVAGSAGKNLVFLRSTATQ